MGKRAFLPLTTRPQLVAVYPALFLFCRSYWLTRIQPAMDFDAVMKSGEVKKEKLKSFLGEMLSFYFESRQPEYLEGICGALNWIGDVGLVDKRETLNLKQNGGDAVCSSVYGVDVELSPGNVIRYG